jgi:serine/threonine protein kinase
VFGADKDTASLTDYAIKGTKYFDDLFPLQVDLSFNEQLLISIQICQVLVYMYSQDPPVNHVDLKPENVTVGHLLSISVELIIMPRYAIITTARGWNKSCLLSRFWTRKVFH